jgi:hypothetical protein
MKTTFKWMFAAILLCGLTVSSCQKPEPEPTKQTVLAGIVGTGVLFYDSVTYSFEYNAEYRIVRSESHVTNEDYVIHDYFFTYSDGQISVTGTENESPVTFECTLDGEGRITHYVKTQVTNDTVTDITNVDFTYDADGHMASEYKISNDPSSQGITVNFVWEGDELKARNTEGNLITTDYVASDAPAQALFNIIGYDIFLEDLCAQGCFGKLPAHMPAQETITTTLPVPGTDPLVMITNYTYTVNADGRLATCVETGGADDRTANYTFNWEER